MKINLNSVDDRGDHAMSEAYTTWGHAKLLQHLDVLKKMQQERAIQPIQIQLCPTEVCESDCPFCAVGNRPYKSSMPFNQIETCLEDFRRLGAKSVEITGGGNPLLYRDGNRNVNDIIRVASSLGYDIGLITNSHTLAKLEPSVYEHLAWVRVSLIKLDEGFIPSDYDFNGFPEERLGFSYIIYEGAYGCRTGRHYTGTKQATIAKISALVQLYPNVRFVRIAGDSRIVGYNQASQKKYGPIIDSLNSLQKFFVKDIGEFDRPFPAGCYVGMIRPYVAASPKGDGTYHVYICNSHVLFNDQTYNLDWSLCRVEDIPEAWDRLNANFRDHGHPYAVNGNNGREWNRTCKVCYYHPNNELLHAVVRDVPDKNFP